MANIWGYIRTFPQWLNPSYYMLRCLNFALTALRMFNVVFISTISAITKCFGFCFCLIFPFGLVLLVMGESEAMHRWKDAQSMLLSFKSWLPKDVANVALHRAMLDAMAYGFAIGVSWTYHVVLVLSIYYDAFYRGFSKCLSDPPRYFWWRITVV